MKKNIYTRLFLNILKAKMSDKKLMEVNIRLNVVFLILTNNNIRYTSVFCKNTLDKIRLKTIDIVNHITSINVEKLTNLYTNQMQRLVKTISIESTNWVGNVRILWIQPTFVDEHILFKET